MATREKRGSDLVKEALRQADEAGAGELDEVSRARMEKRLLAAVAAGEVPLPEPSRDRRGALRPLVVGGGILVAAAAALLLLVEVGGSGSERASGATFHRVENGETVSRGAVAPGETIETAEAERVQVRIAASTVDVTPGSVARLDRLDRGRVEVQLSRGAVEVEFHPERRGEETLVVDTQSSRVEVVGTIFRVAVDAAGATTVSVTEGVVRVTPHDGSEPRLVHAGERTVVSALVAVRDEVEANELQPDTTDESAPPWLDVTGAGATGDDMIFGEEEAFGALRAGERPTASGQASAAEGAARAERAAAEGAAAVVIEPDSSPTPTEGEATATATTTDSISAPPTRDALFAEAEGRLARGDRAGARHTLREIARTSNRATDRARAWNLVADSYRAERNYLEEAEAYRRAAQTGGRSLEAQNALYALARLREQRMNDRAGAIAAYRRYLEVAPSGPNARDVHRALCRLGERESCE